MRHRGVGRAAAPPPLAGPEVTGLAVTVTILPPLAGQLGLARGARRAVLEQVVAPGTTVRGALHLLGEKHPSMLGTVLRPDSGLLAHYVVLLLDGERVGAAEEYETPLRDGAELMLLPAYAGGA